MHQIKLAFAVVFAVFGAAGLSLQAAQAAVKNAPGNCGEYQYWHEGKCVDARQKAPPSWSEGMSRKPAW